MYHTIRYDTFKCVDTYFVFAYKWDNDRRQCCINWIQIGIRHTVFRLWTLSTFELAWVTLLRVNAYAFVSFWLFRKLSPATYSARSSNDQWIMYVLNDQNVRYLRIFFLHRTCLLIATQRQYVKCGTRLMTPVVNVPQPLLSGTLIHSTSLPSSARTAISLIWRCFPASAINSCSSRRYSSW